MMSDILLQAALILLVIFVFLAMHDVPKRIFTKLRLRSRSDLQSKRHFVAGAQLLAKARSTRSRSSSLSIAKQALSEADKAIALDPADAAAHILKALSLDLQGFKPSALDSLDAALSPPAVKSLSDKEKADALFKRAELRIAVIGRRRHLMDPAIDDLKDSVRLGGGENAKAWCLLGECYEAKKMKEDAKRAYAEVMRIDPGSAVAQAAVARLESSSSS